MARLLNLDWEQVKENRLAYCQCSLPSVTEKAALMEDNYGFIFTPKSMPLNILTECVSDDSDFDSFTHKREAEDKKENPLKSQT